jgi:galactose mutarotase-like enzyme
MIAETAYENLLAYRLADDSVRLTILPHWGGKIAEIYDLRRGREWLFRNPALAYRLPTYDSNYARDFDVGGFDECFPNVGAGAYPSGPWRGTPLPDHGEVWSLPWGTQVLGDQLFLTAHGIRLPYRLEKNIRLLGGGRVRFDYRAINRAPFPMPFLWSSHPLFALQPGMKINLPTPHLRVHGGVNFPAQHGDVIDLTRAAARDLSVADPLANLAVKLFSPRLAEGWAELADPSDGATFRFDFDPDRVTHLGLWLNYGGWAGAPGAAPYFNLGLEPCLGAPDTLDTAVNHWDAYATLPPNGTQEWWLEISVA